MKLNERTQPLRVNSNRRRRRREASGREARFIKRRVRPETKQVRKAGDLLLHDLKSVARAIRRHGHLPGAREAIAGFLRKVEPKGEEVLKEVRELRQMNERLFQADSEGLEELSRESTEGMGRKEKRTLREERKSESERLALEKHIDEVEGELERCNEETRREMEGCAQAVSRGQVKEGFHAATRALGLEKRALALVNEVKRLNRLVERLARRSAGNDRAR